MSEAEKKIPDLWSNTTLPIFQQDLRSDSKLPFLASDNKLPNFNFSDKNLGGIFEKSDQKGF